MESIDSSNATSFSGLVSWELDASSKMVALRLWTSSRTGKGRLFHETFCGENPVNAYNMHRIVQVDCIARFEAEDLGEKAVSLSVKADSVYLREIIENLCCW